MIYETKERNETFELGKKLAERAVSGDIYCLSGDLGAGKTQLTKGIAAGMGVEDDVTSPTFNILMVYDGADMPLYHFDLYRLDDPDQLEDIGLYEMLDGDGACVIEWVEQFSDEIGPERLDVYLTRLDEQAAVGEEPPREVRFVAHGERAEEIAAALE